MHLPFLHQKLTFSTTWSGQMGGRPYGKLAKLINSRREGKGIKAFGRIEQECFDGFWTLVSLSVLLYLVEKREVCFTGGENHWEAGGSSSQGKWGTHAVADHARQGCVWVFGLPLGHSHWVFMQWKERNKPWVRLPMDKPMVFKGSRQGRWRWECEGSVISRKLPCLRGVSWERSPLSRRLQVVSSKTACLKGHLCWRQSVSSLLS